jgi:hypothetical protein
VNPHIESTLYYTMSTVAQTLAGAIGLLGAIVLFALQATARSVERAAKRLAEVPNETASALYIRHLYSRRSYRALARAYDPLLKPSFEMNSNMLVYHSTLGWELQHEDAIRRSFWKALLASAVAIGFSISCLAVAPELAANSGVWGRLALAVAVIGAIGCLILYGVLLRVVLRSAPEEDAAGLSPAPERERRVSLRERLAGRARR